MSERNNQLRGKHAGRGRDKSEAGSKAGKATLTEQLAASQGHALPSTVREPLEQQLGDNLSGVRVHFDSNAAEVANQLSAKAFTVGQAIYFNEGQYDPGSAAGQKLIAHEVAHAVQQKGASVSDVDSLDVSSPGDAHEGEAESFAESFASAPRGKTPAAGPAVSSVSKGSISRAVIQRDLLDGGATPPELHAAPQPVEVRHPTPAEISAQAQSAIRQARAAGGPTGAVGMARRLRSGATAQTAAGVESAISGELTEEEKQLLSGAAQNRAGDAPASVAANAPAHPQAAAHPPANAPAHPQANAASQQANAPAHPQAAAHPPANAPAHPQANAPSQQANAPAQQTNAPAQQANAPAAHGPQANAPAHGPQANAPHGGAATTAPAHGAQAEQAQGGAHGDPQGGAHGEQQGGAHAQGAGGAHGDQQGGAHAQGAGGAHGEQQGGAHAQGAGGAHGEQQGGAHAQGAGGAHGDQQGGAHGEQQGGEHAQGAGGAHGQANGPGGAHAQGGAAHGPAHGGPAHGDAAHGDAAHGDAGHQAHVPEAGGRELIEQELAFHENWRVYAENGAAGRAGHLLQTMFLADGNGSTGSRILGGDLAQGAMGAGTQFLIGQGTRLLATRTIASRVPGVGNIIGGAFSAYALFSNGGAGITTLGREAVHGIGGAFSAQNWAESPWLTAADLVSGIKSVLEIIGHVCNILSGLAYAFAAIAAVGGLLSVLFPPLAFLVPYIPVAINFGRACGGIATACLAAANLISPIPPVLRAIHLIFSNNDPIKLVSAEHTYHEQTQGALAAYGSAKLNNVASGRGIRASANSAQRGEIREGAEHYRSAMGGNSAPTPGNFRAGVQNTERAMGMTATDTRTPQQQGRDYFNPESRAHANQHSLEKEEHRLRHDEANHAATERRADRMQERLDADPTARNFRNSANAAETAERHEGIVRHQEHQVELAEFRTQIPSGQMGHHGVGGMAGDASDMARNRARENLHEPEEERRNEGAGEAYHALTHGAEAPHAEHNAQGHVVLPAAPGSLQEIDAMDHQIAELERNQQSAHANASEAHQVQQETHTQATGLQNSAQGVTQHVTTQTAHSTAEQQRVNAQTNDMTQRTTQAQGTSQQGTSSAAGTLQGIAGAARTVDGLLGRVPSNRFFDVSGTKNNVHQFVVGMDQVTGAGARQGQTAGQTNAAVQQRNQHQSQAQSTHAQASAQGNQLAQQMRSDSSTAAQASAQAAHIAQESQAAGQQAGARAAQLRAQRQQKWQALLAWAANHRALREQASGGAHH